jgi:hypothetical protein
MSKPGFEKIQYSDHCLYGPRKLLLCGFSGETQTKFKALAEMLGLTNLPLVWLCEVQFERIIADLIELPDGTGASQSSTLPRAIIVSGITQNELHRLMAGCRKAGMNQALWAALTPTSAGWQLQHLLAELTAERKALSAKKKPNDK